MIYKNNGNTWISGFVSHYLTVDYTSTIIRILLFFLLYNYYGDGKAVLQFRFFFLFGRSLPRSNLDDEEIWYLSLYNSLTLCSCRFGNVGRELNESNWRALSGHVVSVATALISPIPYPWRSEGVFADHLMKNEEDTCVIQPEVEIRSVGFRGLREEGMRRL